MPMLRFLLLIVFKLLNETTAAIEWVGGQVPHGNWCRGDSTRNLGPIRELIWICLFVFAGKGELGWLCFWWHGDSAVRKRGSFYFRLIIVQKTPHSHNQFNLVALSALQVDVKSDSCHIKGPQCSNYDESLYYLSGVVVTGHSGTSGLVAEA